MKCSCCGLQLEDLYPVAGERLAVIRDPESTTAAKWEAARWLIEHGFDQQPLAPKDEIMHAYYLTEF